MLALQRQAGNDAVQRLLRQRAERPVTGAVTADGEAVVQRRLLVEGRDLCKERMHARRVWGEITALTRYKSRDAHDKSLMERQFWRWVRDDDVGQRGLGMHPLYGRKAQNRRYDTIDELERGLHGWVAAKPGRHTEKQLGNTVRHSSEVDLRLNKILVDLHTKIQRLPLGKRAPILNELGERNVNFQNRVRARGVYQDHFDAASVERGDLHIATNITGGFLDVLTKPWGYDFRDKVVVLHDLMEYFGPARAWLPSSAGKGLLAEPTAAQTLSTTDYRNDVRLTSTGRGRKEGSTDYQGTRNEDDPVTTFARKLKLPIWAGSSFTTARMLNLGQWAGVSQRDLTALAHSIFAFWRVDYDHSSAMAYHPLHEVMDIAQNFGVPYDPRNPYREFAYDEVDARQNELKEDIDLEINEFLAAIVASRARLAGLQNVDPSVRENAEQVLDDAENTLKAFLADYPDLPAGERPVEMRKVWRTFVNLARTGLVR